MISTRTLYLVHAAAENDLADVQGDREDELIMQGRLDMISELIRLSEANEL